VLRTAYSERFAEKNTGHHTGLDIKLSAYRQQYCARTRRCGRYAVPIAELKNMHAEDTPLTMIERITTA